MRVWLVVALFWTIHIEDYNLWQNEEEYDLYVEAYTA